MQDGQETGALRASCCVTVGVNSSAADVKMSMQPHRVAAWTVCLKARSSFGARLRAADVPSAEDVALYVRWSAEFSAALEDVEDQVARQAEQVGAFEIASRTKQISSVIAKLQRMNRSNLARIEDIVGCRVIVPTLRDQERLALRFALLNVSRNPRDYRRDSQNGYRAVHFTVRSSTRPAR